MQLTIPRTPRLVFCAALSWAQLLAGAANEDPTIYELEPYVVVATRTPLPLERVSPSVDYIDAEAMAFWQDRRLIDVLQRQAGVVVSANGAPGSVASVFLRGTNSDSTAFFLDGRRLNAAFSGQYDLESLNVNNLESVQLQKGAATVNYGSSGIGGVVDLRTRQALGHPMQGVTVVGEVGANAYRRVQVSANTSNDDWGWSLSGSMLSTDNERENDHFETASVLSRFDVRVTDHLSAELIAQYLDSEKGVPGKITSPSTYDHSISENWLVSPGLRYESDDFSAHVFYSRSEYFYDYDYSFFGSFYNSRNEIETDELSLQIDHKIHDAALLTVGGLYRLEQLTRPSFYGEDLSQYGLFTQLLWQLSDVVELRGGVRCDAFSDFDDASTGNLEAIFYIPETDLSFFAKVATSYAPPTAQDLAFDENLDPMNVSIDTPLDPEESLSYEVGLRQFLSGDDLKWSVVLFRNEIDNLIQYVAHPPIGVWPDAVYPSDTYNVRAATTQGVEFSLDYAPTKQIELSFGYTYMDAKANDYIGSPLNDFDELRLPYRPRHLFQLSAAYQPVEAFRIGANAVGQVDRERDNYQNYNSEIEDFMTVNLVADLELSESLSLFARVHNLLDEAYALSYGYPVLGRSAYFGARLSF
jgi:vitamin B12 transporter